MGIFWQVLLGQKSEAEIRADPKSDIAKNYIKACRRMVLRVCPSGPADEIRAVQVKLYNEGDVSLSLSRGIVCSFWEESVLPAVHSLGGELHAIITKEWSVWRTTPNLRPAMSYYPIQIFRYFSSQITALRER